MTIAVLDNASALVANRFFVADLNSHTLYNQSIANIDAIVDTIPTLDFTEPIAWCLDVITNGTTGLSLEAQQNIWDYERERDLQAINDTKDRIASDWAKQNWPLPDGVLAAQFMRTDLEYANRKIDKSRDIRVESEKIAIEQVRFAVDKYIGVALAEIALYEKAAEAGAHIAAQLAAGLLSSAHAQASVSYSGSMQSSGSVSESTQHQYVIAQYENHNYEES